MARKKKTGSTVIGAITPFMIAMGSFIGISLLMMMFSLGTRLVSEPDSLAVFAGTAMILVCIGIIFAAGVFLVKKFTNLLAAFVGLFVLFSGGAACTRVDPGYVGIRVNLYGQNRGVEDFPLVTGRVWYNPWTVDILQYPTFVQTAIWTADQREGSPLNEEVSFNSKEGMVFTADISMSYSLMSEQVPSFYVKFRSDDLRTFTHGFLHNIARDSFNAVSVHYNTEEIYGEKKEEILTKVRKILTNAVEPYGVKIEQFGYVGAPRPPQNVIGAINAKIQATQNAIRVENEVRQSEAEARKKIATSNGEAASLIAIARGQAEANRMLAESISPQLIEWQRIKALQESIAKWDGKRPMVEGNGSGLLLSMPMPGAKE